MGDVELSQLSDVVRALAAAPGLQATLDRAAASAVDIIVGCDYAGITIVHRRQRVETEAATSPLVHRADELQYKLDEGPCLEAIFEREVVHSRDLTTETRWPQWRRSVVDEVGVRSVLCLPLYVTERTLGGLNLYSQRINGFDADATSTGLALAAHVAAATAAARTEEQLQESVITRTIIGQSMGMLMERYDLTADQAFGVLQRSSQHTNRKLAALAQDVANGEVDLTELVAGGGTSA